MYLKEDSQLGSCESSDRLSHFLAVTGNRARSLIKDILLVVIKISICCHAKSLDLQLKF